MPQRLGERAQRVLAAAPVEVGAGHDHRPLGVAQQRDRALERAAVGAAPRAAPATSAPLARRLGLHEDEVEREVEERRARCAARSATRERLVDQPGDLRRSRPRSRRASISGRTNGTWSISCSEPWPQRIAGARPPSTSIGEWFCCAEAIALMPLVTPGPAVSARDAGLARDLRPALGGERGGRLVADVDDVDALRRGSRRRSRRGGRPRA